MHHLTRTRAAGLIPVLAAGVLAMGAATLRAAAPSLITITVVVTDSESGKPINQAQLTLTFKQPGEGRMSRAKTLTFSSKTDAQGRGRFLAVPEGSVILLVTADHHQTFGKDFEVSKEHPTLEVKLKPPQPVI